MQSIDRKKSPPYKTIERIEIIRANEKKLRNNIPVYVINGAGQELVKIELLFDAGKRFQSAPLVASFTNTMLNEGTADYTATQIAESIDYYGAFLETDVNLDFASVNLYTLNKHLERVMPVFEDIVKRSVFPQTELSTLVQTKRQQFLVNEQKNIHVARQKFNELLFGQDHPYGYYTKETDYDRISRDGLVDFYRTSYRAGKCRMIVTGNVSEKIIEVIDQHLGGNDWTQEVAGNNKEKVLRSHPDKKHLVHKEDALQSAIKIGRPLFNKTHPDYIPLQVLNTVLGGYFGSRLMSNIREDKGYTYGIGSGVASLQQSGYFFISTEVGVEVCNAAIDEIYYELGRLREELIGEDEMQLVRNYMLGNFLRGVDGPFALAEKFKSILEYGLDYSYYDRYIHTVKTITVQELRDLANKYFQKDDMFELVVGKRK